MGMYESQDSGHALGYGWGAGGEPLLRPPPASPVRAVPAPPPQPAPHSAPAPPEDDPLPPAAELPLVDLRTFPIDRSAVHLLPAEVARFYTALPYGFEAGVALIALADVSETTMLSLRLALGREARFARAPRIELAAAISEAYADPLRPAVAPVVSTGTEPETRFRVMIRLHEGDPVDAGLYDNLDGAKERAIEIADQIGGDDGRWPFVHGRFLRPEAVVSVDVVEEASRK